MNLHKFYKKSYTWDRKECSYLYHHLRLSMNEMKKKKKKKKQF